MTGNSIDIWLIAISSFDFDVQRVLGDGLLVMRKIENVAIGPNNRPKLAVVITECGEMWNVFECYESP